MLYLSLGESWSTVVVHITQPDSSKFAVLKASFSGARSINSTVFEVDIEKFFHGITGLADWRDDEVHWDESLLRLLRDNFEDAQATDSLTRDTTTDLAFDESVLQPVPLKWPWISELRDFQERDLVRLLAMRHGANFSVPGAGKTRVSLAYFEHGRQSGAIKSAIVVSPRSAFEAWATEPSECYAKGSVPSVKQIESRHIPSADIVLVNYERVPDLVPGLIRELSKRPTLLILDEAHRMKRGATGKWGQACYALAPHAAKRLILSGTPAPNGPEDLSNLFGFVWPGVGRRRVETALSQSTLHESSRVLAPFYVRTTKKDLKLPPASIEPRFIEFGGYHRELYQALIDVSRAGVRGQTDSRALNMTYSRLLMAADSPALLSLGASTHDPVEFRFDSSFVPSGSSLEALMRDLPGRQTPPKYVEALKIIQQNRENGRKTILWSTFVRNLTSLHRILAEHDLNPAIVHGGTIDRDSEIRMFREDSDCWVLLSNPATLGEGVSLHRVCHEAIYLDRDYNAGRYLQSLDRIHRLGLAPEVKTRITLLISKGTIDEIVDQRLHQKIEFQLGILNDPYVEQLVDVDEVPQESFGMNMQDVRSLLDHIDSYGRK